MKYRRTTSVHYEICKTQAEMYREMAYRGYDIGDFSNAYLKSDFCKNAFDTDWSYYQLLGCRECLEALFIDMPVTKKNPQGFFDPDVAYWIGFTYRLLYIETKIPSSMLSDTVTFEAMCRYYPGLHTVDEEQSIDLICEDFGLSIDVDSLAKDKELEIMASTGTIHEHVEELRRQMEEHFEKYERDESNEL